MYIPGEPVPSAASPKKRKGTYVSRAIRHSIEFPAAFIHMFSLDRGLTARCVAHAPVKVRKVQVCPARLTVLGGHLSSRRHREYPLNCRNPSPERVLCDLADTVIAQYVVCRRCLYRS